MENEIDIRMAAFAWIREREALNGGVFAGTELIAGFKHKGERVTLKGPAGIWFPRGFGIPLSISTALRGPYRLDDVGEDGLLTYAYRGFDPEHRDNAGLREAFRTRTPLIYFKEVRDSRYQAIWPVIILADHRDELCVTASLDPAYGQLLPGTEFSDIEVSPLDLRRYAWVQTRQRLHQSAFRDMVIAAYDRRCAICRLNHPGLLDAAHILPDRDERGTPVVPNGLSLCKIHHAAYDQDILGIDPDCRVHIRGDILEERDGPMLLHGLQELDGSHLALPGRPRDRPDRERLARRFEGFKSAS
jgi:putative restriction endonuclease